jgi:peptidoglycan/LPS O-acetylase OafA/YrhL
MFKRTDLSVADTSLLIHSDDGLNNFDALRLVMALLVVWSHCFALGLPAGESVEPISLMTNGHYNAGNIAVMVFFAISGFLISKSYLNSRDTLSFLIKRIRRIYPGYIVATTIGAFVIIPLFSTVYKVSAFEVAKTIGLNLLLRGYAPPSIVFPSNYSQTLNGSLWSIPYEFWCYIGIAALGIFALLTKPRLIASIVILAVLGRAALDLFDKKPGFGLIGDVFGWPYQWLLVLPCFLIGTVFFLLRRQLPRSKGLLILLLCCLMAACYAPLGPKWQKILAEAAFPVAMAYCVFYFAFSSSVKIRNVAAKGDLSYGTYLYAFPIQQMLLSSHKLPFPIFMILSVVLSVGAGFFSWHIVEKWFLRRKPTLTASELIDNKRSE